MSNLQDFWRTEQYHNVKSRGDLGDLGQVVIGNAALSSKANPIPGILENLLGNPCIENMRISKFAIMTHMVKAEICSEKDTADVTDEVMTWFLNPHCHACHGTGVKNIEQQTCSVCNGEKKYPAWPPARRGCCEVENLFMWRELQLRKRNSA